MTLNVAISVLLAVFCLLIGLLVLLRNDKSKTNQSFFVICIVAALWTAFFELTFLSNNLELVRLANSLSYVFGLLLVLAVLVFTYYFPRKRNINILKIIVPVLVVLALVSFSDYIAGEVILNDQNKIEFIPGSFVWVYSLIMLTGSLIIALNLLNKSFNNELDFNEKKQQKLLTGGLVGSLVFGVSVAVILPVLKPSTSLDQLAPLALIIFLVPVGAAVARYKLFEFRLVLARALAYSLVLSVLAGSYIVISLILSSLFINSSSLQDTKTAVVFFIIAVLFAVAFAPLKKRFDYLSNKLFFRDAYDTQLLLDEFNQTLVSTIDIDVLLNHASEILQRYLKADFASFAIREKGEDKLRFLGSKNFTKHKDMDEHRQLFLKQKGKVIITDQLDDNRKELKNFLLNEHIDIVARLTASPRTEGVGYLLLGEKKSGNPYTTQDIAVVEIVANELVIAIQNALQFEEIQQFNITLQEKIEDATKKLRHTNEKLKALDETKDEFISMASHQLRTPLTAVKGYISMVLEGDAGKVDPKQSELLEQAFVSAQRMVYLIADLLNVSRLKTGKFIIQRKPTQLADVIETEIAQLVTTAKARGLELSYEKPKDFPLLMLDETKTRQVIMNFADNAIYYTPVGGHIRINLVEKESSVEFTVADDGIGVPKAQQHNLFTKFFRAGNAQKARPDGTGLGLFMAKKVIVAQGGAIIFHSEEGKGSTFGFTFPKIREFTEIKKVDESSFSPLQ